jgi:hypothetical protein
MFDSRIDLRPQTSYILSTRGVNRNVHGADCSLPCNDEVKMHGNIPVFKKKTELFKYHANQHRGCATATERT